MQESYDKVVDELSAKKTEIREKKISYDDHVKELRHEIQKLSTELITLKSNSSQILKNSEIKIKFEYEYIFTNNVHKSSSKIVNKINNLNV